MERFYFDIHDGERFTPDEDGSVCESRKAMRDIAIKTLPDMARDELPDGNQRAFTVKVRDESGRYVFQATLSLMAEWLDQERQG